MPCCLRAFFFPQLQFRTLSKTWLVGNEVSLSSGGQIVDDCDGEDVFHRERYWGEILEKNMSKDNLVMANGGHHQTQNGHVKQVQERVGGSHQDQPQTLPRNGNLGGRKSPPIRETTSSICIAMGRQKEEEDNNVCGESRHERPMNQQPPRQYSRPRKFENYDDNREEQQRTVLGLHSNHYHA